MGIMKVRTILKNKQHLFLITFFIIYSVLLLYVAKNKIASEDEMYTLHTTSSNLGFAIKESYNFEQQPPVYFGLLSLWRNISDSMYFIRILSIAFIFLGAIFIYKTCIFFYDKGTSILTTILFLLNPFIISESINARPYALLIFCSASSIYFFYKAYLTESSTKINILIHALIGLLGIFTQYLFVFLLIAEFIALLISKERKKIQVFFAIHLFIAVIFCVNWIFIPNQMEIQRIPAGLKIRYLKTYFSTIHNFLISFQPFQFNNVIEYSVLLLYIIWMLIFFKKQKFSTAKICKIFSPVFFLLIITVVVFLSVIIFFTGAKLYYSARYMTILFPSLFLLFIFTLTIFGKKYFLLCFMFLSVYYLIVDIKTNSNPVRNLDYEEIAEYIGNNVKSDIPLLFYKFGHSLPFQHYYSGNNKIIQLPFITFDYNLSSNEDNIIKDTVTLNRIFKMNLGNEKELIYITDQFDKNISEVLNYNLVESYLADKFYIPLDTVIMGRSKTNGLRILKLIRKDSTLYKQTKPPSN
jgi:hypothetical protein